MWWGLWGGGGGKSDNDQDHVMYCGTRKANIGGGECSTSLYLGPHDAL